MITSTRPTRATALVLGAALTLVVIVLAAAGGTEPLTAPKSIVLGAVEGLTEYVPVSSTGHLLVVERLLGLGTGAGKVAADSYAIAIQLGAILAVVVVYRARLAQLARGLVGRDRVGQGILGSLVVAFLPAATVGAGFDHAIKAHLFGPWPIVVVWTIGGVFLVRWRPRPGTTSIEAISISGAVVIGAAQVLALWPGVSRSLVTIVAALAVGCEMAAAVEFSFLLGLGTLSAATVLDLAKNGHTLVGSYGWRTPMLGVLVAFGTAVLAIRWVVSYLRTRSLAVFGWYRLATAALTIVLIVGGVV